MLELLKTWESGPRLRLDALLKLQSAFSFAASQREVEFNQSRCADRWGRKPDRLMDVLYRRVFIR